ncbi:ABC transporter ATP-binding protein, partial [Rhizobium ruizarguesonis]
METRASARAVPRIEPDMAAGTTFAAVVIIAVLYSIFTNQRWGWGVFAEWFFAETVLVGLGRTLLLTVLAAISGSI